MVTAETAVVLPVLLLVLLCAVAAVTVVGAQLRCVDAAREGARAAARGETDAVVAEQKTRKGSKVKVEVTDDKALREGGFGGIIGVGQGSANPPRLVRLTYAPRGASIGWRERCS